MRWLKKIRRLFRTVWWFIFGVRVDGVINTLPPDTETPKPFNCPKCCSRIVFDQNTSTWRCAGCLDRSEVEKYLAADFPGNIVPERVVAKMPCGWSGRAEEFGKTWR